MKTKKLNKMRIFNFILILAAIALFAVIGFKVYKDLTKETVKVVKKDLDVIEPYGYKLDDRDTKLYKTYFKELKANLKGEKIDEEAYAKSLTQLFVVDFYNLDNKLTSSDIGGLEFIHPNMKENFILKAKETMYKTVQSNLYKERKQVLPIVKSVTIDSCEKSTYNYKNTSYEAYKVTATWEYKEDLKYENKGLFILIKDKEKDMLYIVEKQKITDTKKTSN